MTSVPRVQARSGAERPHRPRVDFPFILLSSRLASRLHFHPPSRLDRRKTNCEQITSHPTLTASRFPFLSLFVSPLSLYFRQRRSTLSRSSTAPVRSRTFLVLFFLISADIFLIFLLHFS